MTRPGATWRGFTLLELVVAMAVTATLAALAVASYGSVVREARRLDARTALLALAAAQERHNLEHGRYATRLGAVASGSPPPSPAERLGFAERSEQGHYALALDGRSGSAAAAGGWLAVATPLGPQAADRACARLQLDHTGARRATDALGADATRACWG